MPPDLELIRKIIREENDDMREFLLAVMATQREALGSLKAEVEKIKDRAWAVNLLLLANMIGLAFGLFKLLK